MAVKKKDMEPEEVPAVLEGDDRKCDCGAYADVYDGRCRRCALLPE